MMAFARSISTLIFAIVVLLPSVGARAEEAGSVFVTDPSRDLTRLNYYPHPYDLYIAPDFQVIPTDLGIPSNGVAPLNTSATHYWQFDLNLIYGLPFLASGLRFGVSESVLIHRWTDTT